MSSQSTNTGAESWSDRYRAKDTPWDIGAPHPELARRIANGDLRPRREGATALVPGAGYGHDALALAEAGFVVTAVDLAPETHGDVARRLESAGGRFLHQDVLGYEGEIFDLVFDHTFFCAIEPAERGRWGRFVRRVLAPGGRLVAIVFPSGKPRENGGPPYTSEVEDMVAVLPKDLELMSVEPVGAPLPRREWREWWAVFESR
ncbi:MAG: methyltransferase domain-containing protein [Planctomycetota bacterium]